MTSAATDRTGRQLDHRSIAMSPETIEGIATLVENIRMRASEHATRILVFSSASTADAVALLASALVAQAECQGMRTFGATLTSVAGRSFLVPHAGVGPLAVELETLAPVHVRAWVERIAPGADLLVIAGPSLADSIDAALLACACDGLVIVAESEVTERAALRIAAERARIAGCRTLGVVMHGTKDRMPSWVRRLMRTSVEPRELPIEPCAGP